MNYQLDKRLGQRLLLMLCKQIGTSPLFIWGGLLTLLLSVASMATQELTSPGPIKPAEIAASPVQSEAPASLPPDRTEIPTSVQSSTAEISPPNQALPLWLFGAIAMGCAGGSWLISQQVTRRPMGDRTFVGDRPSLGQVRRPRRPPRPRTSLAQREATESGRVTSRMERSRPASARVPQQTSRYQTAMRGRSYMTGPLQQAIRNHGPQKQVQETWPPKPSPNVVVPGMETSQGDRAQGGKGKGGKKNLAEMMDIRKGRSVTSVVRNI